MAGDPEKSGRDAGVTDLDRDKVESNSDSKYQDSSDGHDSVGKTKTEGRLSPVDTPPEDNAPVTKLDSKMVKVEVEDATANPYRHLPEHEAEILRRQVFIPETKVGIKAVYRFASRNDFIIIAISAICSIAGGAALPLMTVVFGQLAGEFQGFFLGTTSPSSFTHTLDHMVLYFVYLAIAEFVTIYISTVGWIYTGEHISGRIREQYLAACLRQNMGFFDKLGAGEITTRITADTNLIQDGISEKVGLTLTAVATFVTAFIIAYVKFWKLALILTSTIVAISFTMSTGGLFIVKYNKQALASYAEGGTVAEEVISSIRNATAFGTQEKLAKQYDNHLREAEKWGIKNKTVLAIMLSVAFWVIFATYGLAFWQGAHFYVNGETGLSQILTILMAMMMGSFSLGNVAPNVQAFTTALSAAAKIYYTIDRQSPLDPELETGQKLEHVEGSVELRHIKHIYPSRPEVTVMKDVSLLIPAGKKTALVGASGSGKSTIVGLVERFYDPVGGQVLLDGHDISTLNLRWLRQQISLVSQEPTLFACSIMGNIKHGLIGTKYENEPEEIKTEMCIKAAKMANAHDFVTALPEGYETNVGERGFLLSGGQKQRIAISRAIVSDPKILLLDEATSALDTKSEGVVQAALEVAAAGRTTITIAHRLSTIKDADNIVVMSNGEIVEQGTHDELLERKAAYYNLVEAQKIAESKEMTAEEEDAIDERDNDLVRKASTKSQALFQQDPDDLNMSNKLKRSASSKSQSSLFLERNAHGEYVQQYSLWTLVKLIGSFNRTEIKWMLVGLFFSIICGGGNPTQSVFFAEEVTAISLSAADGAKVLSDTSFWSLMYLMLACVQFIAYASQGIAFALCSERLIRRVRDRAFRTMLRQDIGFFDREENSSGALTSFLSTETTHVAGLSGVTLGTIISVLTTLIAAIAVSCAIGWKLALVCTSTIPILLSCGFFRFWLLARFQARAKKAYEKSASYACEATSAIRTVASLTREYDVLKAYQQSLASQQKESLISVAQSSLLYASSQSFMFLCIALGFWYGGTLISSKEYDMFQFFLCFQSIIFGAQSAGTIFSFAPDMGKAKQAAQELKTLFDRKPAIDSWSNDGEKVSHVEGAIEFRDVHFRYPTRPEQPVLRGLNLTVKPGQYVALVGASGCGKSTTIALLERFYDPLVGGVYVDGKEISSLNINDYRSYVALVSQEPTLYQGSIKENILLGRAGVDGDITDSMIEDACREANILEFIKSLP